MNLGNWIERLWYGRVAGGGWVVLMLLPLSWLYRLGHFWRWRNIAPQAFSVPIIVIGNYTAGGSGKTPLIIALAKQFMAAGHRVGILTHGHLSKKQPPRAIQPHDRADEVGDEATLIYHRTRQEQGEGAVVWLGRPRAQALAQMIDADPSRTIILVDDGLQDPSFARLGEVVWAEAEAFGNGRLIPAGPLRQPLVDLGQPSAAAKHRLVLGGKAAGHTPANGNTLSAPMKHSMGVYPLADFYAPDGKRRITPWSAFAPIASAAPLILITAIARPWRVQQSLAKQGIAAYPIAFADHQPINVERLIEALTAHHQLDSQINLLLTEKDAVKLLCDPQPHPKGWTIWVLDYGMTLSDELLARIDAWLNSPSLEGVACEA